MIKLNKGLFILPLLLFLLGLFGSSNYPPVKSGLTFSSAKHSAFFDAAQTPEQQNSLLHHHFHKGLFESSQDISQLAKNTPSYLKINDNIYQISHHSWYLLTLKQKVPNSLIPSSPSSLRAPPVA